MSLNKIITELLELEAKATESPWKIGENGAGTIWREFEIKTKHNGVLFRSTSFGQMEQDAKLIVEMRNHIRELCEALREAHQLLEYASHDARWSLEQLTWLKKWGEDV